MGDLVIKPSPGVPPEPPGDHSRWSGQRPIAMYLLECHQIVEIDADCLAESGTVSEDGTRAYRRPKPQIERGIGRFTAPPKAGAKGMHDHSRLTDGPTRNKGTVCFVSSGNAVIFLCKPHVHARKDIGTYFKPASQEGSAALSCTCGQVTSVVDATPLMQRSRGRGRGVRRSARRESHRAPSVAYARLA